MFLRATAFNQDLSQWDVSKVTSMGSMFSDAHVFNQDLSKWDVSAVRDMAFMFYGATAFRRELCSGAWVNSTADKSHMFTDSPGYVPPKACKKTRTGNHTGWDLDHLAIVLCVNQPRNMICTLV